jgi:CelD/BcsL family acetyltransferase involved in cellulose biosynthesis
MRSLQVRVYESLADLESLRPAWEKLLCEFRGATTFSSWEWLAPWWRAFGESRQLLVLAFLDESSLLVGLAPLCVEKRRAVSLFDLQVLRFWGDGSGDSDNLDFPVLAGYEDEVARALLNYLNKESSRWDFCEFNTMPGDCAVGNCLARHLTQRFWIGYHYKQGGSAIVLPEKWEQYTAQLSAKERGKIAYRRNLLARKYQTRFYKCENPGDLGACLENLFSLHQKRWNSIGEAGSFTSPARRAFYSEMAALLLGRGQLELWFLELNGKPAAVQFGFRFGRTFFSLQEGYDPLYSSDSVGYVLRAHVIRQLISADVRGYDFLAGEAASKKRWNALPTEYVSVHFARSASKGALYLKMVRNATEGKEWLRHHLPENAWRVLHWLNCVIRGIKKQAPPRN